MKKIIIKKLKKYKKREQILNIFLEKSINKNLFKKEDFFNY